MLVRSRPQQEDRGYCNNKKNEEKKKGQGEREKGKGKREKGKGKREKGKGKGKRERERGWACSSLPRVSACSAWSRPSGLRPCSVASLPSSLDQACARGCEMGTLERS